jgi:hypothetical protein
VETCAPLGLLPAAVNPAAGPAATPARELPLPRRGLATAWAVQPVPFQPRPAPSR